MLRRTRLPLSGVLVFVPVLLLLSAGHLAAQDEPLMPLAGHGTYVAGIRTLDFVDTARSDRPVTISLWYPGIMPAEKLDKVPILQKSNTGFPNLPLDLSGAPYPVVLFSHGYASGRDSLSMVLEPLVTHGFVVVTVQHDNDTSMLTLVDRPLDIRFVLDQLEDLNASGELAGLMRLDRVGVIGISDGGYLALAMSGAQISEAFMSQWGTGERDLADPTDPRYWYADWNWDALKAYYEQSFPPGEGGFLQPMSDPRVAALVSYLPCWAYLFGEEGLSQASVPILLIAATEDIGCPYEMEAVFAYEHLGSPIHEMLSLVGAQHDVPATDQHKAAAIHYTDAFFAYILQDQTDYAMYFTADYLKPFDELAWGVYSGS